jgi:hypothetical protein
MLLHKWPCGFPECIQTLRISFKLLNGFGQARGIAGWQGDGGLLDLFTQYDGIILKISGNRLNQAKVFAPISALPFHALMCCGALNR